MGTQNEPEQPHTASEGTEYVAVRNLETQKRRRKAAGCLLQLFADPEKLARMLKYHIVPGYYTANDLLDRLFLKTLEGQRLRVWSDISEVPLGEREIDTQSDALSYVTSDTVTTAVRESIKINGGHVI